VRMNADCNSFSFLAFQRNVVVDEILRESAGFRQEAGICFKSVKRFVQRAWNAADFLFLFFRKLVDVLVEWTVAQSNRIQTFLDAVKPGRSHSREWQVWVSRGVRRTELDAAAFRRYGSDWNTTGRGTGAFGEYEVNRRFVTRTQTCERVRAWVCDRDQSW